MGCLHEFEILVPGRLTSSPHLLLYSVVHLVHQYGLLDIYFELRFLSCPVVLASATGGSFSWLLCLSVAPPSLQCLPLCVLAHPSLHSTVVLETKMRGLGVLVAPGMPSLLGPLCRHSKENKRVYTNVYIHIYRYYIGNHQPLH